MGTLSDRTIDIGVKAEEIILAVGAAGVVSVGADCHTELVRVVTAHILHGDAVLQRLAPEAARDVVDAADGGRKAGNELLAISHNANVSDGWMYPVDVDNTTGRPIDAAWAAARDRNERLVEIKQRRMAGLLRWRIMSAFCKPAERRRRARR